MTFEMLKECVLDLREALKCVSQAEKCCEAGERRQIVGLKLHTLMVLSEFYNDYRAQKAERESGTDGAAAPQE